MPHETEQHYLLAWLQGMVTPSISTELDWPYIQQQASRHGIMPLLYDRIFSRIPAHTAAPPEAIELFHTAYHQTYLHNTILYQHFFQILNQFTSHHISPIGLKGIVLAEKVYSSIAVRPMQDIDLLLAEHELEIGSRVLEEAGYTNLLPHLTYVSPWHRKREAALHEQLRHQGYHLPTYIKQIGTFYLAVELHHHLTSNLTAPHVRTQSILLKNQLVKTLSPEYFLYHLCVHLHRHAQGGSTPRLIWFADIAEYVRSSYAQIQWDDFMRLCQNDTQAEAVLTRLRQALDLFQLPRPPHCPEMKYDQATLLAELFPPIHRPQQDVKFLHQAFAYGRAHGLRYVWETVFPSREFLCTRYNVQHRGTLWWYYLIRVWKAIYRGGGVLKALIFPRV